MGGGDAIQINEPAITILVQLTLDMRSASCAMWSHYLKTKICKKDLYFLNTCHFLER